MCVVPEPSMIRGLTHYYVIWEYSHSRLHRVCVVPRPSLDVQCHFAIHGYSNSGLLNKQFRNDLLDYMDVLLLVGQQEGLQSECI